MLQINIVCNDCKDDLINNEEIYCGVCYTTLKDELNNALKEIDKLNRDIQELNGEKNKNRL